MPVSQSTRFGALPVHEVTGPDGSVRHVLGLRLGTTGTPGAKTHRITHGEGVDLIARKQLGDERLWWRILDVNPLVYPLDLGAGDVLRLPAPGVATRANRARSF